MKTLIQTRIIGIDHGYGAIKTAQTITPTGITAYNTEPTFSGNILEYDGVYYRIGEGHKAFIDDKVIDNDFYVLTLMAIARELNQFGITEANIHIAAGIPLRWVSKQREKFQKYLLKNESAEFIFNGKEYRINIIGCHIFPQGYPAILDRINGMFGTNMLADIGNGTLNVMYISNKRPVEEKCWTVKLGVNQCIIAACNAVSDNFGGVIEGTEVENIIRGKPTNLSSKYIECIKDACKKYAASVFEVLRKYEYNPDAMKLYVVGGGGYIIKQFGEYDENRVIIISDVCAAAKGYEQIALNLLRKELVVNG